MEIQNKKTQQENWDIASREGYTNKNKRDLVQEKSSCTRDKVISNRPPIKKEREREFFPKNKKESGRVMIKRMHQSNEEWDKIKWSLEKPNLEK